MAGHSQFKNIMHRKGAQDAKRAKIFTKLIREIAVSLKTGQPDPNFNPRLRAAIATAREHNLPKDKIDKAIKSASGSDDSNYEEIRYEGYAPGGVALIVEAATDNRNRTASEVRSLFNKCGGAMGETGSVSFMFDKVGQIEYTIEKANADDMLEAAIDAGATDCETSESSHEIICTMEDFNEVREKLSSKFGDALNSRLTWRPKNYVHVSGEQAEKLCKLIESLEDLDDVQFVCGNYDFDEETMRALTS